MERIAQYMLKAVREAKVMTSWSVPNGAYEGAMRAFVERVLASSPTNPFLEEFVAFARRVAFFGRFNSLSQVLLKLTSPGVPDLYQGTELWDLSLVDPDNRRVVDYERRRRMLREVKEQWSGAQASRFQALQQLLQEIHTGRIKLYLMWRALEFRREQSELFQRGVYAPLLATGERQEHVCAFARVLGREAAVTVAPRLVLRLTHGAERPPLGTENWGDTALPLPEAVPGRRWLNVLTGETLPGGEAPEARTLRLGEVLGRFPVALLKNA